MVTSRLEFSARSLLAEVPMVRSVSACVGLAFASLLAAAPETIAVDGGQIAGTSSDGVRVYKGHSVRGAAGRASCGGRRRSRWRRGPA